MHAWVTTWIQLHNIVIHMVVHPQMGLPTFEAMFCFQPCAHAFSQLWLSSPLPSIPRLHNYMPRTFSASFSHTISIVLTSPTSFTILWRNIYKPRATLLWKRLHYVGPSSHYPVLELGSMGSMGALHPSPHLGPKSTRQRHDFTERAGVHFGSPCSHYCNLKNFQHSGSTRGAHYSSHTCFTSMNQEKDFMGRESSPWKALLPIIPAQSFIPISHRSRKRYMHFPQIQLLARSSPLDLPPSGGFQWLESALLTFILGIAQIYHPRNLGGAYIPSPPGGLNLPEMGDFIGGEGTL